jgi:C-terminal processing protease CtpA/Prc
MQKLKDLIIEYTGNRAIAAMDAERFHSPEQFLKQAAKLEPKMRWAYNNPSKSEYLYGEIVPSLSSDDGEGTTYAYVYLPQFPHEDPDGTEANLFQLNAYTVLRELFEAKPDEWIFDFRGHSGGLIGIFMRFISLFMPKHYVVHTKDTRDKSESSSSSSSSLRGLADEKGSHVRFVFSSGRFRMFSRRRMVIDTKVDHYGEFAGIGPAHILVDEITGSCGEFMALLLRLNLKKALIYGTHTIGAMTIPDVIAMDGYVLSIPTAVLHIDGQPHTTIKPDLTEIPPEIQAVLPY